MKKTYSDVFSEIRNFKCISKKTKMKIILENINKKNMLFCEIFYYL